MNIPHSLAGRCHFQARLESKPTESRCPKKRRAQLTYDIAPIVRLVVCSCRRKVRQMLTMAGFFSDTPHNSIVIDCVAKISASIGRSGSLIRRPEPAPKKTHQPPQSAAQTPAEVPNFLRPLSAERAGTPSFK